MPLQNRVTPTSDLIAVTARGLFMGNRGRLHDPATRSLLRRRWASKAWIICALSFQNRRRRVMGEGYTELFFLDEVTALAAGHRPCFECRHGDATVFASAFPVPENVDPVTMPGGAARMRAGDIDAVLHGERLNGAERRYHRAPFDRLPDGAMVLVDAHPHAVRDRRLLPWTPARYLRARARPRGGIAVCLTPPSTLTALARGYHPTWHPSARP